MKTLYLICVIALASACAQHRVRCDGRLEPINPPPAADAAAASPTVPR
ncbi:MAG: hypothetical protein WAU56_06505 [Steroidobacteraceae bacterium]